MAASEMFQKPAGAYERFVGRYGPSLAAAFADFAGVTDGMRALDVGCGPGPLTALLAGRLGAGRVSAAEPSEAFAAACRERVPGVEVVEAGAEELPFEDDRFDITLSQLVVNFIDEPVEGVREMARVTHPGGVVAACVWDYGGEMTLLRKFWDAAIEILPERARVADEGVSMEWCGEGQLAGLWAAAGLDIVRSGDLLAQAEYANFEDLWSPLPTGVGPAGAFCASLDESEQKRLKRAFRRRLGVGEGPFELTARAWAVVGKARRAPPPRTRSAARGKKKK